MLRNILLIPVAMLAALLVFEMLARIWIDVPNAYPVEPGLLVLDKRGFWMPSPGYRGAMDNRVDFRGKRLTVDDDGTRHVPCRAETGEARQRIFLLGDSQTFGFGLSDGESWPNRLQCDLGPRVAVYNMGVHGTNIDQYARRALRQVQGAIRANDIVVAGVTWNDLISLQPHGSLDEARADAARSPAGDGGLSVSLHMPARHAAAETWRYQFYLATGVLVPVFGSWKGFAESLSYSSALARFAVPRLRLLYYRVRPSDTFKRKLGTGIVEKNMKLLAHIGHAVDKAGGHFVVLLLPNRLFFDDSYYNAYSAGGAAFPTQDYMTYLTAPFCTGMGLGCASVFDALKTPGPDTYTFSFDGHYNEKGARAVARALRRFLERDCVAEGRPCLLLEQ